jgi:superfamily II DNA/RNA helicase
MLQRITTDPERALSGIPRALVVVPTRELCLQVSGDLAHAAKHLTTGGAPVPTGGTPRAGWGPTRLRGTDTAERNVTVTSIYGGRPYEPQIEALQKGVDVVVGTPGRLLDLAQQGHLQLGGLSMLVLDEADEMLDLGFLPDIERILRQIPDTRQSMLFSATMPDPIITLARTFMNQPTHIRAEAPHSSAVHATTEQFVYRAHALDKVELVSRVLQATCRGATMVFTRTKRTAQKVADELAERGFKVGAVHGDLGQAAREKALKAFRSGDVDVLVATDVAARGIDIDDITHVINYQIPEDEQAYVHRIGRTGRAGKAGIAVTLVDWDELARWEMIDKALGLGCPAPAETYSSSPHIYAELDIPTDAKGTVGEPRKTQTKRAPADNSAERPARNRTRNRRRTRGGESATGHSGATVEQSAPAEDAATADDTDASRSGQRRRRRRPRKATAANAG